MSTLFIPLCLAALGIVLRGSGFAFHEVVKRPAERSFAEHLFAASSVITPFFMGTVVGAIASGRVPPGNATGDPWSSWLNPVSILVGVLFVATGAYLAAVFLITDARHADDEDLERYFADRALIAAIVTGAIAVVGIFVLREDATYVYDRLTSEALPLVIASAIFGIGALVAIRRGARLGARPLAVGAVTAVIWGWGVAQFPYLLPTSLTISDGAGTGPTLTMVIVVFIVAALLVLPALGLLYTLTQRSLLQSDSENSVGGQSPEVPRQVVLERLDLRLDRAQLDDHRVIRPGAVLGLCPGDEGAGDEAGDHREQREAADHQDGGDQLAGGLIGDHVPVAHRGHGLGRPPHPEPDVVEGLRVNQALDDPEDDDRDHPEDRDDRRRDPRPQALLLDPPRDHAARPVLLGRFFHGLAIRRVTGQPCPIGCPTHGPSTRFTA